MEVERRRIELDYAPRSLFLPFHNRTQRWSCLVAHRRAGKTVATINDKIKRALSEGKADGRYAYIAPLFNQAKDIAWQYLKHYARPLLADSPNETELRVDLLNGSRIRIYGADNPDRLRGIYLDGVTLDEYGDMNPAIWTDVVRPALSDRKGWATFIGTPKGKNGFYDIWKDAQTDPAWFALMLKASSTSLIDNDELAEAKHQMGEDQYAQEYECSFDAAIKGAFYATELRRADEEGRIGKVAADRGLRTYTAWDLGRADSTAIWFIQVVGKERRLIDYYEASGVGLDHYAKVLDQKGYLYETHYFPHDVGAQMLGMDRSRVETLRSLGIEPTFDPKPGNVLDGVNAVRLMLDSCWIDSERCARGLEALKQYRREYDDKLKDWKMNPLHDWSSHGADALRTFATQFEPPTEYKYKPPRAGSWMAN
jgi:hypothetical protein